MWKTRDGVLAGPAAGLESGGRSGHARAVENTSALSGRRDMFLDERGTGLRVTWHPERDLVVLSVWQGDGCVGTFRMSVQDIPRLSGLLARALGDWVDQTGGGPGPVGPGPVGPGSIGPGSDAFSGGTGARITGEWDVGGVGTVEGNPRTGGGPAADVGPSTGGTRAMGAGLSVQRRIRLSRPMLKMRGMQDRRRRGG
jgi:hypothetical protein